MRHRSCPIIWSWTGPSPFVPTPFVLWALSAATIQAVWQKKGIIFELGSNNYGMFLTGSFSASLKVVIKEKISYQYYLRIDWCRPLSLCILNRRDYFKLIYDIQLLGLRYYCSLLGVIDNSVGADLHVKLKSQIYNFPTKPCISTTIGVM